MTASTPRIDNITVPGAGDHAGHSIALSVSCELMKNQLPGTEITATKDTAVVQDSAGHPMLFTIGSDAHLRLLVAESQTATGFTATDLMQGLTGYSGATAFDVAQDLSGRITVAAALTRADGPGTDIVIAPMISDDRTKADWSQFWKLAPKVDGIDQKFVARKIQIGSSDGGKQPFTIVIGDLGGQEYYYRIDTPTSPAQRLEFPENVPANGAGVSMSIGFAFGDRATWFLYSQGQSVTLEATTLPSDGGKALTYDYSPGYAPSQGAPIPDSLKYNCVATPTGTDTDSFSISSDVYVGTDTGVYLFQNARAGSLSAVADGLKDVHELYVTQDAANISVWALCSPSKLYYIYGKKGPSYTWHAPVLFNPAAIHIAPMRSKSRQANELFVVGQDESVTHHWQDPGTTLWQQRTLSVPDSGYVLDAVTFTTTIHVEDDAGNALSGTTLEVTASEWFYATANGLVYSMDMDNPAALVTDAMGAVTMIAMTADIAPPILHVTSPVFGKVANVYPNGGVHSGLAAIRQGSDLKNAKTADGKPVLDPSTPQSTCDGVAANMAALTSASAAMAPGLSTDGNTFVVVEDSTKHTAALPQSEATPMPQDGAIAMTVQNGAWQRHPQPAALMASFDFVDDLVTFAGDALHWLENAFDDVVDYVGQGVTFLKDGASFVLHQVENGLELALSFGAKLVKIALTTFGAVLKALNWLLKLVRIGLKEFLAWLGHLFGWDDIWETHKVIASMMRSGIDYAVSQGTAEIEHVRHVVADAFESAKQQLSGLVLAPGDAAIKPKAMALAQRSAPVSVTARSSSGNFSNYHLQHSGMLAGGVPAAGPQATLASFLTGTVEPMAEQLGIDLEADLEDIVRLLSEQGNTVADFGKLAVDLASTVLDPVSRIVDGMFQFVESLLKLLQSALEDELEIPFLTEFYEFITALLGDEEDFTVINGIALLLSIPFVEIWKAATGSAPFADGTHGLDSPTLFEQIVTGGTPAPSPSPSPAIRAAAVGAAAPTATGESAPGDSKWGYSCVGGGFAALAGIGCAVYELYAWGSTPAKPDYEPISGPEPDPAPESKLLTAVGMGLGIAKFACSFPVPVKRDDWVWGVKCASWALGLTQVIFLPFIPNRAIKGLLGGICDAAILCMIFAADCAESPGPVGWPTHVLSNLSGCARGFGAAAASQKVNLPLAGAGWWALTLGVGGGWLGGGLGIIYAVNSATAKEACDMVNVGG